MRTVNDAWQELKGEHPEAEQHWVFIAGYRQSLIDAADAIQALHPGEVKASVEFLRDRAARLAVSDAETAARQAEVERLLVRAERAERERDRLARLECGCASCYRPGEYSPMQCPTLAKQMGDNR